MPDEMRVHDAVHVREFQWARHVRGDPDWCRRRAFGVRVHPLDAGCTAHRDGNDGVVHRNAVCEAGDEVRGERSMTLLLRAAEALRHHVSFNCCCVQRIHCCVTSL